MRVRYKDKRHIEGQATSFNTHAAAEVLLQFDDGDGTSEFIRELDVLLPTGWKDMMQAFKDQDIVPDNYNAWFGIPNAEEKARGYI
jgi:hypothetical protein